MSEGARLLSQEVNHSRAFIFKKPQSVSSFSGLAHISLSHPAPKRGKRTKERERGVRGGKEERKMKESSSGSDLNWTIFRQPNGCQVE